MNPRNGFRLALDYSRRPNRFVSQIVPRVVFLNPSFLVIFTFYFFPFPLTFFLVYPTSYISSYENTCDIKIRQSMPLVLMSVTRRSPTDNNFEERRRVLLEEGGTNRKNSALPSRTPKFGISLTLALLSINLVHWLYSSESLVEQQLAD